MKKHILILSIIVIVMLLWALNPNNPYAYYVLLRWFCCGIFAYLAFKAFAHKRQGWVWLLGITALFYNPVSPVHLNRSLWSAVNLVTIVIIITYMITYYRDHRKDSVIESGGKAPFKLSAKEKRNDRAH